MVSSPRFAVTISTASASLAHFHTSSIFSSPCCQFRAVSYNLLFQLALLAVLFKLAPPTATACVFTHPDNAKQAKIS